MATRIKLRRGTYARFVAKNPLLADGEPAYARDVQMLKIGDGVHNYNDLRPTYANGQVDIITLNSDAWVGETAPYTQKVNVDFMYEFFNPSVNLRPSNSYVAALVEVQEFSKIYKGVSGDGWVEFYATDIPKCSLSLTLKRL